MLPSEIPFGIKVMCPRAHKDLERVYSPQRVLYPHKAVNKKENKFVRVSWNEALNEIATRLKNVLDEYGPEKVLVLDYAGNMGLLTRHFSQRLWYFLKASRTDYSICDGAGELGISLHYGKTYGALIDELYESKLLVYWGFNPARTSIHNYHIALKRKKSGNAKIIVIDPVKTETSKIADLWLRPKFGTDIYLALGIANYIINNDKYDHDFIEKYTVGFREFSRWVSRFNLDIVSEKTGIKKSEIIDFAELYVDLKPNLIFIGYGLQRRRGGANTARAISLLPALNGEHRGFYYSNSDGLLIDKSLIRGTHLGAPSHIIPQAMISEYLEKLGFKFIYVQLINPIGTHPDTEKIKRYFIRNDVFVVVHETHWSDTAKYADIVLPAPTYLEKDDFITSYWHNYLIYNRRILKPLGESRSEIYVQAELARRLNINNAAIFEDPLEVIRNALTDSLFQELMQNGIVRLPYLKKNSYQTPSGKIEFKSSKAIELGLTEFPEPIDTDRERRNQFLLVFNASIKHTHTQFEDIYGHVPSIIFINSDDAVENELRNNDKVALWNETGSVVMRVKISENIPRGIIIAYRGARTLDGKRINAIVPGKANKYRESEINGVPVYISKIK